MKVEIRMMRMAFIGMLIAIIGFFGNMLSLANVVAVTTVASFAAFLLFLSSFLLPLMRKDSPENKELGQLALSAKMGAIGITTLILSVVVKFIEDLVYPCGDPCNVIITDEFGNTACTLMYCPTISERVISLGIIIILLASAVFIYERLKKGRDR